MTDWFLTVVGAVGGYVFGVLRTLSERRNERRDMARRGYLQLDPGVFSIASRDLLNDLYDMRPRAGVWHLPDGTNPKDRWKDQITRKFNEVRDALRAEVEASRGLISWLWYHPVIRRIRERLR